MHTTEDLAALLSQHTSADALYHHPDVASFCYTEGAKAFFQHAGAGAAWLRDLLATDASVLRGVMAAPCPCKVLMIVTDSGSRAGGQALGSGQRSALITVSEELEWDYMCDDERAGLGVPAAVFFGAEVEETDCPVGAWTFFLAGRADGSQGMLLALPSEVFA